MGEIPTPNHNQTDLFDHIVQEYEKDLLRICCLYIRDWHIAEDIVQDVCLKAYKSMDSFRGESNLKTWLIKIALNCCRDYRKSTWYRYIDHRVSIDQLPLSAKAPSDEHLALALAIMKLNPKHLEVVLVYFYEGYTLKDIADMLNITEAAVSSRLRKAKQKLKTTLEGENEDDK